MSFQWLDMRISEERDRRARENAALARLEEAFAELRQNLGDCVEVYSQAFTDLPAHMKPLDGDVPGVAVSNKDKQVTISIDDQLPGFVVEQPSGRTAIVTGVLPGGNMFYKLENTFLSLEELTKHILDRTLFPKLKD